MKSLKTVHTVCGVGSVLCRILKIVSILAAVVLLLVVLLFSAVPKDLVLTRVSTETVMEFRVRDLLGEGWAAYQDQLMQMYGSAAEKTEEGVAITQKSSESLTLGQVGVGLLPLFVKTLIEIAFFHCLGKSLKQMKEATSPFSPKAARSLRHAAYAQFAVAVVPAFCAGLMAIITGSLASSGELDLSAAWIGLFLLGIGALLDYGAKPGTPEEAEAATRMPPPPEDPPADHHPGAF